MRIVLLAIAMILILFSTEARPRYKRPKSCTPKVLLPGHSKPIKCNKARKIKNSYF